MKKLDIKTKRTIVRVLIALLFGAILAVCTMCMSYQEGAFMLSGWRIAVIWATFSIVSSIGLLISHVHDMDRLKNLIVSYLSILVTVLITMVVIRERLTISLIPILFTALVTVVLAGRKVAYLSTVMSYAVVAILYLLCSIMGYINNALAGLGTITIKLVCGLAVIALYKENFNRVRLIAEVAIAGVITALVNIAMYYVVDAPSGLANMLEGAWILLSDACSLLLCLVLSPLLEWALRLETNFKMLEYITFDQPLLKELSEKAPGTFYHSLAVGNLAERCANAIGENVNVAKACAYYHDVGKLQCPEFFSENQVDGYNPHDDIPYEESARIITRHTDVGHKMLTDRHFPRIIAEVAKEHHGDGTASYFYIKAKNITEGSVDAEGYRYGGPKPTTRISAIVMIADTVEAATRSMNSTERTEVTERVSKLIKEKLEHGQFDNCDLTLRQIAVIRDTLVESLLRGNHSRVSYPTEKKKR